MVLWDITTIIEPTKKGTRLMKRLTYLCLVCTLSISSAAPAATVRTVALSGQQAPGTPSGVNFSGSFSTPVLNDAGQTAFSAFLTGSSVIFSNDAGIWSEGSGSLALVARDGEPAPGTPDGVNYSGFLNPVLNDAGQNAFFAVLTGSGVNNTNNQSIWSEGSGSLALVARGGDQAPGAPSGANYNSIDSPELNNAGQTAFLAYTSNGQGIWLEDSGSLTLIAFNRDHAPGTPSGVNFGGSPYWDRSC
jgi:hypothetical protein